VDAGSTTMRLDLVMPKIARRRSEDERRTGTRGVGWWPWGCQDRKRQQKTRRGALGGTGAQALGVALKPRPSGQLRRARPNGTGGARAAARTCPPAACNPQQHGSRKSLAEGERPRRQAWGLFEISCRPPDWLVCSQNCGRTEPSHFTKEGTGAVCGTKKEVSRVEMCPFRQHSGTT
jgi:hypothetical protein